MKIALLSEKYPPDVGGLAISVERMARLLQAAGHAVTVFTLCSDLPPGETSVQDWANVRVLRLGVHRRTDDTLATWADLIIHYSETLAKGEIKAGTKHDFPSEESPPPTPRPEAGVK